MTLEMIKKEMAWETHDFWLELTLTTVFITEA
jgi:hypothetical protein